MTQASSGLLIHDLVLDANPSDEAAKTQHASEKIEGEPLTRSARPDRSADHLSALRVSLRRKATRVEDRRRGARRWRILIQRRRLGLDSKCAACNDGRFPLQADRESLMGVRRNEKLANTRCEQLRPLSIDLDASHWTDPAPEERQQLIGCILRPRRKRVRH